MDVNGQEIAVAFRVTQIDLDKGEEVSAVHAIVSDDVRRLFYGITGHNPDVYGREGAQAENFRVRLTRLDFEILFRATGKIPGNDPGYHPGLNDSMARVYFGLIGGE